MRRSFTRKLMKPGSSSKGKSNLPDKGSRFRLGYEQGYEQGIAKGKESFGQPFHGTSIVIPSYNQVEYLARCIESIMTHTAEPYEIIVVNNASTDETDAYLEKRSLQIRSKRLDTNHGFSGGVNQGIMMAKGDTIVILNNDVLVTPGWLTHMLRCLQSDSMIGAVGPVTNYISGDQQIAVPYKTVDQMWEYAATHFKPDETKWRQTDRLVGFCILFRRELLERVGYFDEGFRVGNYEDDDWMIRIRLSGLKLLIAGDSFIHHFGSVSMKNLGQKQFNAVHRHNELYFREKWGNPHVWVEKVRRNDSLFQNTVSSISAGSPADFFPSHVLIRDQGGQHYFLCDGAKSPCAALEDETGIRPVVLSRMDIRSIPTTEASMSEAALLSELKPPSGELADGQLVSCGDGTVYQWIKGSVRPIVSEFALKRWNLKERSLVMLPPEKLENLPHGLPIIAPPILKNPVL
ncbi:glycosyltransferase family 2 protein [Paenibacillus sp. KQZ6P-2]|uniref:Glycosyltransferase family 2 protein n=1 Tax=Paenibacillus mangrovi TaxID=2931978 RepID=A0A9X1WRA1_9BACL|nr:glycosyltransferase family 2 protein [Paenibacillus mangrovi]MCJ8013897.1 glycosyltransferase family 2 protein [Paenibacillus mangrovi]